MFLRAPYKARHEENRMKHEGDVSRARAHFYTAGSENLRHLLQNRYNWMNEFIGMESAGIEVGCGTGVSKEFIRSRNYKITDFADYPWLDVKNVDALATPFGNSEFDFVVSSNMVHHVPYPIRFFDEMHRILKPGGFLLIQEINASFFMRALLRLMRHEGYSFAPNVFDPNLICTDPDDLWSANCAIPNLLFDNVDKFKTHVTNFDVVRRSYSEFFCFLNSGGVIAKTKSIPLPRLLLNLARKVDTALANTAPSIFALQRQIVLRKKIPVANEVDLDFRMVENG